MTTADELQRRIDAADEALEVFEHPAFRSAVLAVEKAVVQEWQGAQTCDERERLHAEIGALKRLLSRLRSVIADGEMAEAEASAKPNI